MRTRSSTSKLSRSDKEDSDSTKSSISSESNLLLLDKKHIDLKNVADEEIDTDEFQDADDGSETEDEHTKRLIKLFQESTIDWSTVTPENFLRSLGKEIFQNDLKRIEPSWYSHDEREMISKKAREFAKIKGSFNLRCSSYLKSGFWLELLHLIDEEYDLTNTKLDFHHLEENPRLKIPPRATFNHLSHNREVKALMESAEADRQLFYNLIANGGDQLNDFLTKQDENNKIFAEHIENNKGDIATLRKEFETLREELNQKSIEFDTFKSEVKPVISKLQRDTRKVVGQVQTLNELSNTAEHEQIKRDEALKEFVVYKLHTLGFDESVTEKDILTKLHDVIKPCFNSQFSFKPKPYFENSNKSHIAWKLILKYDTAEEVNVIMKFVQDKFLNDKPLILDYNIRRGRTKQQSQSRRRVNQHLSICVRTALRVNSDPQFYHDGVVPKNGSGAHLPAKRVLQSSGRGWYCQIIDTKTGAVVPGKKWWLEADDTVTKRDHPGTKANDKKQNNKQKKKRKEMQAEGKIRRRSEEEDKTRRRSQEADKNRKRRSEDGKQRRRSKKSKKSVDSSTDCVKDSQLTSSTNSSPTVSAKPPPPPHPKPPPSISPKPLAQHRQ